jgi:hypothetical protein
MLSKRTFLKRAAVATAAAAVTPTCLIASSREGKSLRPMFDWVVFNERYADARSFATALSERAAEIMPMAGDVGVLWYRQLRVALAGRTTRIAGMGTHTDLFILETLARDAGLRVQYRGEHDCRGAPALTHRMWAGAGSPELARAVEAAGCSWPTELARALTEVAVDSWSAHNPLLVCTNAQPSEDHPARSCPGFWRDPPVT